MQFIFISLWLDLVTLLYDHSSTARSSLEKLTLGHKNSTHFSAFLAVSDTEKFHAMMHFNICQ